ncbi:MAG: hypothetical protein H6Q51_1025, partial [Deltaproteobacteria bacterium]|nr:hypothetical protein [Deltaproteobacteria bacterium]
MLGRTVKIYISVVFALGILASLGCQQVSMRSALEAIKERGELRVLTRQ